MSENLSAFFYLVASVCFILALRGLSSPVTARVGNVYGIAGMLIAVVTTLLTPHVVSFWLIILGILIGGTIGTFIALRIQMTALPQLVAAFHSLVGLAAVCVAAAAFTYPELYGIGVRGSIHGSSLIEMSLGMAIGAITFTGSVVAFAKLQGLVTGRPLVFPGQHLINGALGALLLVLGKERKELAQESGVPRVEHAEVHGEECNEPEPADDRRDAAPRRALAKLHDCRLERTANDRGVAN